MEEFNILAQIIDDLYGIDKKTLLSKCRKRELVELRYVCANILRLETKYIVEDIGDILHIDHSTVCYAKKQHDSFMDPKNSRTYAKLFNAVHNAYINRIQTPERLTQQLTNLLAERVKINQNIDLVVRLLKEKGVILDAKKINLELVEDTSKN